MENHSLLLCAPKVTSIAMLHTRVPSLKEGFNIMTKQILQYVFHPLRVAISIYLSFALNLTN